MFLFFFQDGEAAPNIFKKSPKFTNYIKGHFTGFYLNPVNLNRALLVRHAHVICFQGSGKRNVHIDIQNLFLS